MPVTISHPPHRARAARVRPVRGLRRVSRNPATRATSAAGSSQEISLPISLPNSRVSPVALVALVAGLWLTRRTPRTDRTRAALALWGGWLIVTGMVFSYMQGTIHPYYAVRLAPAVPALVAVGSRELWQHRNTMTGRVGLAATTVAARPTRPVMAVSYTHLRAHETRH